MEITPSSSIGLPGCRCVFPVCFKREEGVEKKKKHCLGNLFKSK